MIMNPTISSIKKLMLLLLVIILVSCHIQHKKHKRVFYATKSKHGYCCHDGNVWYVYYLNSDNTTYSYFGKVENFLDYIDVPDFDWSPSSENVSNFSDIPSDSISEATGESVGEQKLMEYQKAVVKTLGDLMVVTAAEMEAEEMAEVEMVVGIK